MEPSPEVTIRKATAEERRQKAPSVIAGGPRVRIPKYLVVPVGRAGFCASFGLPMGGDTRAEAVFWAERWASKNGYGFARPAGWENVVGKLPTEKPA